MQISSFVRISNLSKNDKELTPDTYDNLLDESSKGAILWFRRAVSSVVVVSYLMLMMGQSYAMKSSSVVPCDGHVELGNSSLVGKHQVLPFAANQGGGKESHDDDQMTDSTGHSPDSTPEKERGESLDTDIRSSGLADNLFADEKKSKEQIRRAGQVSEKEQSPSVDLLAVDTCIKKLFYVDKTSFSVDMMRVGRVGYTTTREVIVESPVYVANGLIWTKARAEKLLVGAEMPDQAAYYKTGLHYSDDQAYYDGQKESYGMTFASILLAGALAYSLKAEGKVFGYTVFAALAKEAYFYEKFYYEHAGDPYYIQNKFMTAITAYTAIMLPFYLLYQTSLFIKNMYLTKEEKQIKEHYGVYLEKLMSAYIIGSALSAGFFIAADYFVAAYGLTGTPQTTREDLTTAPAFLGLAFTLTMYNMKRKAINDSLRDWYRWYYGDSAEVERTKLLSVVDGYQEKVNTMPKKADIKPTQVINEDIESQKMSVQTVEELEHELSSLGGMDIVTKIIDGKLVKERRKAVVGNDVIQSIRANLEARKQESTIMKVVNGMRKAGLLVVKNWPLAVSAIFSAPVAYLSYESFVNSTQLVIAHDFQAISDMVLQQQYKLHYQIIEKYKGYNEQNPYEWLEQCLDPNNMHILSNETYTLTDDTYFNTTSYGV